MAGFWALVVRLQRISERMPFNMKWHEWRYNKDEGKPVFFIKHLVNLFGCRINLHKIVDVDDADCYHTHPAKAIRIILWGGYYEHEFEQCEGYEVIHLHQWSPRRFGIVKPEYCHRISTLLKGPSYSLWIRFRKTTEIKLVGSGWGKNEN